MDPLWTHSLSATRTNGGGRAARVGWKPFVFGCVVGCCILGCASHRQPWGSVIFTDRHPVTLPSGDHIVLLQTAIYRLPKGSIIRIAYATSVDVADPKRLRAEADEVFAYERPSIESEQVDNATITAAHLPAGAYFTNMTTGNDFRFTRKNGFWYELRPTHGWVRLN